MVGGLMIYGGMKFSVSRVHHDIQKGEFIIDTSFKGKFQNWIILELFFKVS